MSTPVALYVQAMQLARCTPNHPHVHMWCVCVCVCVCCAANECSCPNGSPKTGAACTEHDAAMCSSCNRGFNIDPGKTACSGAYSGSSFGELCLTDMLIYISCSALCFCPCFPPCVCFAFFVLAFLFVCFAFVFVFETYGILDVMTLTYCRPSSH